LKKKNAKYFSFGLYEGLSSSRRSLQSHPSSPVKEQLALQDRKFLHYFLFSFFKASSEMKDRKHNIARLRKVTKE
jgi:hypothetical protein